MSGYHYMKQLQTFLVTQAGEDDWKAVMSTDPVTAGELWAEGVRDTFEGETTYELDVMDAAGKLYAVTVDVSVGVSFDGFATKHPSVLEVEDAKTKETL